MKTADPLKKLTINLMGFSLGLNKTSQTTAVVISFDSVRHCLYRKLFVVLYLLIKLDEND